MKRAAARAARASSAGHGADRAFAAGVWRPMCLPCASRCAGQAPCPRRASGGFAQHQRQAPSAAKCIACVVRLFGQARRAQARSASAKTPRVFFRLLSAPPAARFRPSSHGQAAQADGRAASIRGWRTICGTLRGGFDRGKSPQTEPSDATGSRPVPACRRPHPCVSRRHQARGRQSR